MNECERPGERCFLLMIVPCLRLDRAVLGSTESRSGFVGGKCVTATKSILIC